MAELTGSEILAKALRREGVDDLFFLMGGPMLMAETACIEEGIRPLDTRHEQAAAFMAQAYSRLPSSMQAASAASMGPPMRKNRSSTPSRRNALARISEPVSSAPRVTSIGQKQ